MNKLSYLSNADPALIDEYYKKYQSDPDSVDYGLRRFFEGFDFSQQRYPTTEYTEPLTDKEFKVINLIEDYRKRGHLFTKTNPVRTRRKYSPTLDLENYGLNESDLDTHFVAGSQIGIGKAPLKDIIRVLEQTYCQSIGVEYVFIRNTEITEWLQNKMERTQNTPAFTIEEKTHILHKLTEAVGFEKFIHKKFPGQKRFSLEGAESLIPALDILIEKGVPNGIEEFIIGMPHRGRLNVLANILKKSHKDIISEFEGKAYDDETLLGDVKYHLGFTSFRKVENKQVKLSLTPNPSHLEAVDPVVQGIARAKIDTVYNGKSEKIAPVLIHGDASIAGQGIIYEIIQMSGLEGYTTGGTIHLVVNNQLGFTTNYLDGRTSTYCTDVAKTIHSPIFHVNGDDVEAVVYAVQLALEFRQKFRKDVFIDLLCYRKYGHNEGDEPRFTQPILYKVIEKHPNPKEIYIENLLEQGVLKMEQLNEFEQEYNSTLEKSFTESKNIEKAYITSFLEDTWKDIIKATDSDFEKSPDTSISKKILIEIGNKIAYLPSDKKFFRKTIKLQEFRKEMINKTGEIDWALAELLAFGSLLHEGIPVRISGQDTQRGTFSQRHAVLTIEDSEEKFIPLKHLHEKQGRFDIYNSLLSEYGVVGFEYGYALTSPYSLTLWEAQFGDFGNGAQIIIDQYLSSAEDKWNIMNDLVLLLPHGYEGQGPEHSSGRLERFLTLCAENNIQVANCTTPANYFHLLRRQLYRDFRKPLVVFTPKSLLRHPGCVSPINDFTRGGFNEIIDDNNADPKKIKKVVLCSGKIYYDLLEEKERLRNSDIAIVRLEQIYPLPIKKIRAILSKYSNSERTLWVQEEPVNMGAWSFIQEEFHIESIDIKVIARPPSGSPATGSSAFHKIRQQKIVSKTFMQCDCHRLDMECKMVCVGNKWRAFEEELEEKKSKKIKVNN